MKAGILSLLLCVGCAALKVDVSVYDHVCATAARAEARARQFSDLRASGSLSAESKRLITLADRAVDDWVEKQLLEEDKATDWKRDFANAIRAQIQAAAERYGEGLNSADQARGNTGQSAALYSRALDQFAQGDEQLFLLKEKIESLATEVTSKTGSGTNAVETGAALSALVSESQVVASRLTGGLDLFEDPLASQVANADRSCWEGEYGRAFGRGFFGNSDIAIKMDAPAEFTVKGVRVDADAVTQATFQSLRQAIGIVAAAYGVPLPSSQQSGQSSLALPVEGLSEAVQSREQMLARARLSDLALRGILAAIIDRRQELASPATRAQALGAIQDTFSVYRPQLVGNP